MTQQPDSGKKKALELAIAHIQKQYGEGAIMALGKHSATHGLSVIKTGAIALDIALGIGGVPRGRIVEIFGPESSGKSTLATHIVANAQKNGGLAAYIDAEHALDPAYATKIGVNIDELMISQPDNGEEALNIAEMLARSNAVDVIVIDSVAALVPKSELDGEIGDQFMGLQARMMSQALRKLTATLARSNTCAIFINQIREKIGIMFGNPETTTGGRALKFYASIRMDIRRIGGIKSSDNTNEIGSRVKVKVVKNKCAPPFQTAEFDVLFNEGFSHSGSLVDVGVDFGVIEKKGTWFSYGNLRLGQGREAAKEEVRKKPELAKEIEEKIYEKINKKPQEVPAIA
ncbi:MAG: recombinase RecA [Chlamydiae bacterium RIFCSPHIGHO2_12_FULL_44_59]|nr:MAG: recombinase RecA [Chlamydiae bacterium RIFCSPHIGHO2_01_FULL_44_39]OGN57515.1 MAG: recombinase RecA [Chlamydiae bacterium RIFCSPHIGHO2_02_FULL_45_9]OGN61214.1 MAG: recombinase RecA [Chlamydiae bacterium RIFCSPHIGHO2_12_FULL_44_59]OGN65685.1 MAG: recombinase RecA [Chlamydiae bacterium RIFCSPLOWO2_01_FULL_44_52]OGN68162.1 MAG: recombinase RecA [Chlamydiae bacterium RIFCSPLOWO2_02_FULL_45_22]OGN68982.1 MAG: recombinase RecA [Chlamydiae bacterium RIFCSPLOWO2_12_FULL_45_20]